MAETKDHNQTPPASWKAGEFREIFAPYTGKLRNTPDTEREPAALWDICHGCILWLPKGYDLSKNPGSREPPKQGVLDHPVLVLNISVSGPEDAVVTFAVLRSFKDLGPDESHPKFWDRYLKIGRANAGETPDIEGASLQRPRMGKVVGNGNEAPSDLPSGTQLLYLERERGKGSMKDDSYLDLSGVYDIGWQELQCYAMYQKPDAYRHRLTFASYQKVLDHMESKIGTRPHVFVETNKLWETFARNTITST